MKSSHQIGLGAMGEVYRARGHPSRPHRRRQDSPRPSSESPEARQRFDLEARAISSLSHPNICHLYDVGQHEGTSLRRCERCPGEVSALALDAGRKSTRLFSTKTGWASVALSPDGRWLAYSSNESGLPETNVVPFRIASDGTPSIAGGKWQVSNGGGATGKELFFINGSYNTLTCSSLSISGDHFQSDKPHPPFRSRRASDLELLRRHQGRAEDLHGQLWAG